jgi:hypothetical protein
MVKRYNLPMAKIHGEIEKNNYAILKNQFGAFNSNAQMLKNIGCFFVDGINKMSQNLAWSGQNYEKIRHDIAMYADSTPSANFAVHALDVMLANVVVQKIALSEYQGLGIPVLPPNAATEDVDTDDLIRFGVSTTGEMTPDSVLGNTGSIVKSQVESERFRTIGYKAYLRTEERMVRAMRKTGLDLYAQSVAACKDIADRQLDKLIMLGEPRANITGLLNYDGFEILTENQNIYDLIKEDDFPGVQAIFSKLRDAIDSEETQHMIQPDTVIVSPSLFNKLSQTLTKGIQKNATSQNMLAVLESNLGLTFKKSRRMREMASVETHERIMMGRFGGETASQNLMSFFECQPFTMDAPTILDGKTTQSPFYQDHSQLAISDDEVAAYLDVRYKAG